MQNTSSFIFSLVLHGIILFAIVSYPTSRVIDLTRESYEVSFIVAAPDDNTVSKVLGPKPKPDPKPVQAPPKPQTPAPTPAPEAVAVPVQKPAVTETPPLPEAKPVPAPEPEKPETPQPIAQAAPAPKPKEEEEEVAPPAPPSAVFSALADLQALSEAENSGSGNGTDENASGGIKDIYIAQVMLIVQQNWSMPTFSRDNHVTQVLVHLDLDGTILDRRIEVSSGIPEFDASVINTLDRLAVLPEPPTQELTTLTLVFNSLQK